MKRSGRVLWAALTAAAVASSAAAQEAPPLGGYVKSYLFQQIYEPYELDRVGARLQLTTWGGDGDPASYFAAVDFELDSGVLSGGSAVPRGAGLDVYPVELYVNFSTGPVELRLGQQFVFWGRTSWVNPTDVITAWDFVNMASEVEDYRVAPLAARLGWYPFGELKVDLVWLPVFQPDRLPVAPPDQVAGLPVTVDRPALPGPALKNGEFGARVSQSVSAWAFDWALAAYHGFDKMPVFELTPIFAAGGVPPMPTGFTWGERYERMTLFGGDLAKAFGPFVFKAEGAFKLGEDADGTDPTLRNDRIEYVAGLDWVLSENLDLGVQYIGRHLLDYDRDNELAALRALTGTDPGFVEAATTHEASFRFNASFLTTFGAQAIGIYNFTHDDFFVLGFLWWDVVDAVKAYVGTVAFGGTDDATPYGRQEPFSRAFAEVKYSF